MHKKIYIDFSFHSNYVIQKKYISNHVKFLDELFYFLDVSITQKNLNVFFQEQIKKNGFSKNVQEYIFFKDWFTKDLDLYTRYELYNFILKQYQTGFLELSTQKGIFFSRVSDIVAQQDDLYDELIESDFYVDFFLGFLNTIEKKQGGQICLVFNDNFEWKKIITKIFEQYFEKNISIINFSDYLQFIIQKSLVTDIYETFFYKHSYSSNIEYQKDANTKYRICISNESFSLVDFEQQFLEYLQFFLTLYNQDKVDKVQIVFSSTHSDVELLKRIIHAHIRIWEKLTDLQVSIFTDSYRFIDENIQQGQNMYYFLGDIWSLWDLQSFSHQYHTFDYNKKYQWNIIKNDFHILEYDSHCKYDQYLKLSNNFILFSISEKFYVYLIFLNQVIPIQKRVYDIIVYFNEEKSIKENGWIDSSVLRFLVEQNILIFNKQESEKNIQRNIFNRAYKSKTPHWSGSEWKYMKELLWYINKEDRILDVWCWTWVDVKFLFDRWYNIIGIDYAQESVKLCNQRFQDIYVVLEDIENVSFEAHSFDFVYSITALQYTDMSQSFREIYRILDEWGKAFFKIHLNKIYTNSQWSIQYYSKRDVMKSIMWLFQVIYVHEQREYEKEKGNKDHYHDVLTLLVSKNATE